MGELGARDWLGFCVGEAGCREKRADGNEADGNVGWGGREGERKGLERMRTDLQWARGLVTGGRKSWSAGWAGVMGRVCCVCEGLVGG